MPAPEDVDDNVAMGNNCPSCGAVVGPGTPKCPACGTDLATPESDVDEFEDVDEMNEDEDIEGKKIPVPVKKCIRCGDLITDAMDRCRKCGLPLKASAPAPQARPPQSLPPPAVRQGPPPGQAPWPAPGPRGPPPVIPSPAVAAPARPAAPVAPVRPLTSEEKRALREKYMIKGLQLLVGLGIADAVVWAIPQLWTILYVNLAMCIASLVVIGMVSSKAASHFSAARSELSDHESGRLSKVLTGLVIILIVPIHEVLNLFPLGYYSASWTSYGWTGLINPMILFAGSMVLASGIQGSRERLGYFGIWKHGVTVMLISPIFALIQVFFPILISPDWFHGTIGLLGGTVMGIGLILKSQRNKQFDELDAAVRQGDELVARGQFDQAVVQYDAAIGMAHTLYSHLIYNPESPYAQVRVPAAYSEPWFRKGRALARQGGHKRKKAVAIFDMILEMDPNNQTALLNRSEILAGMNDFDGAIRSIDRVLQLIPGHPDALKLRAAIAEMAKKYREEREKAADAESVFGDEGARDESGDFEEA